MAQDPKLQALANHINARLAQPSLPPLPPLQQPGVGSIHTQIPNPAASYGLTGPAPTLGNTSLVAPPTATLSAPVGTTPSNGMEGYFQNESQAILKQQRDVGLVGHNTNSLPNDQPSKKKILLMGVYVGGAVFLISFIILVAIRPRFVMKKVKKENGTEELKCNFLAIFLISLALLIIVLVTAGISAAKAG